MIENPPRLIQGGMGVGVSNHKLARAVAISGQEHDVSVLGVVSTTGISVIGTTRLQNGDPDQIRGYEAFDSDYAQQLASIYRQGQLRRLPPKSEVLVNGTERVKKSTEKLTVASAFAEVYLAKEGHRGQIGHNILEKTQREQLTVGLGTMMADVDYCIIGAGIPHQVPAMLENFVHGRTASYKIDVMGGDGYTMFLDPNEFVADGVVLKKPKLLVISSSHTLAQRLAETVEVDGFVMEGPSAGGHNAPARSKKILPDGQPEYGPKDEVNLQKMVDLGIPFWLAGGHATPEALIAARKLGAAGIQVGSAFALCDESGYLEEVKHELRNRIVTNTLDVRTSATASPSGFPFQVVQLPGTLSDEKVYTDRKRICNIGHLTTARQLTEEEGGGLEFSCLAEPGGKEGSICLCNGLGASAGQGGLNEPMIVTLGKDTSFYDGISKRDDGGYTANSVVEYIFQI